MGGVVAGALFAFASNRAVYSALGHYDMVTTQWLPFYALMLLRAFNTGLSAKTRRRSAALAGVFLAFAGLAEMILALFLAIFTLIVVVAALVQKPKAGSRWGVLRELVIDLVILGIAGALVWAPALVPILMAFRTADFGLKGWGDALMLSTDLLGWFTPTVLHPLFGGELVNTLHQVQARAANPELPGFRDVNTVFLGWVSLALALLGAVIYRRKVAIWIWTAVIFGLFTLGPLLQINGRYRFDLDGLETTVPLPFVLLHYLPIVQANRAPNRNSAVLMLALAVLAGWGVYWLLRKLGAWSNRAAGAIDGASGAGQRGQGQVAAGGVVAVLLAGLVIFEHAAVPFPLSDARIPAVYAQIAADPAPVSVLQLPLGWRNSFGVYGPEQTLLQYYQSAHGKPMLGGNISRAPDFKMDYFRRIPYFQALTEVEFGREVAPEISAAAAAQAPDLVYLYNTGYVVLTPPIAGRRPYDTTWQASWDFVKSTLPLEAEPFYAADGIEAYRVVQPEGADTFRIDLGVAGTNPYRGEGWDEAEVDSIYDAPANWATGAASQFFVPLRQVDPTAAYTVQTQVHPFTYPGSKPQQVALMVNGQPFESHTLVDGWQTVAWQVPGSVLTNSLNRLELVWSWSASPRVVVPGSRQIGTTGVDLPVDADLKAFADGGFIALFDDKGEQRDGSAGRRGVNVTLFDPKTGELKDKAGFDTAGSAAESERLVVYLDEIPSGASVLIASYGDAWQNLSEAAVQGLRSLGADVTLEGLQGQAFALAGVKGAAPGTAAQDVNPGEAFLRVSLNRDRRDLAGAVDWLEIGR
ncbi:MAG: hypothetical protein IPK16_21075 [Anaerolineales bacterium]|nr:hypothetical protein [Anaerolineales bacterium]